MRKIKSVSERISNKFKEGYSIYNFNSDAKLFIESLKKGLLCFSSQSRNKNYIYEISVKSLVKGRDGIFIPVTLSYFCSLLVGDKIDALKDKIIVKAGSSKAAAIFLYYDIIRSLKEQGILTMEEYEKYHWINPNIM